MEGFGEDGDALADAESFRFFLGSDDFGKLLADLNGNNGDGVFIFDINNTSGKIKFAADRFLLRQLLRRTFLDNLSVFHVNYAV